PASAAPCTLRARKCRRVRKVFPRALPGNPVSSRITSGECAVRATLAQRICDGWVTWGGVIPGHERSSRGADSIHRSNRDARGPGFIRSTPNNQPRGFGSRARYIAADSCDVPPRNDDSVQERPVETHLLDERPFVSERTLKNIERGELAQ